MKKIFLIDNYDSFTYNLLFYLEELGCDVTVKRNDLFEVEDIKNFGAGDLIEINHQNKKNFFIPMNKENLISVDIDNKVIIVDPIEGLVE